MGKEPSRGREGQQETELAGQPTLEVFWAPSGVVWVTVLLPILYWAALRSPRVTFCAQRGGSRT